MGSIYEGICAGFMKLKKSWETPLLLPILNAYHMRGISGPKIFLQNTLTKPRFSRDKWRGIVPLNAAWQVHNHSSVTFFPTRAGRPCAMTVFNVSDKHEPPMQVCNRQGDDGGDRTMILLERAGRKRRGESPMDPIRYRASDESRAHGGEVE